MLLATYHPPNQSDQYFFDNINTALDRYAGDYDEVLLPGDFNAQDSEKCIDNFIYQNHLTSIVKEKTFIKNLNNPTCFLLTFPKAFKIRVLYQLAYLISIK